MTDLFPLPSVEPYHKKSTNQEALDQGSDDNYSSIMCATDDSLASDVSLTAPINANEYESVDSQGQSVAPRRNPPRERHLPHKITRLCCL